MSLIPAIAILSFVVFVSTTAVIGARNIKLLEAVKNREFPILRASDQLLFGLQCTKQYFKSAVTTADEKPLESAAPAFHSMNTQLGFINARTPEVCAATKAMGAQLKRYCALASSLSLAINSADTHNTKLSQQSAEVNRVFDSLKAELEAFQAH